MTYAPIIIFGILSTLFVTFINLYFIKNNIVDTWEIIKVSMLLIPVQFITSLFFSFYYIKGIVYFSYPTLVVASYGFIIITSFVVNYYFLKKQSYDIMEILGVLLIIIGLSFIFYIKFK